MKIVILRDIKANVYGNPMFVASLGGAIRSFGDEIAKTDGNPLALHPDDFELYHFGEYDEKCESLEQFILLPKPVQIALGSNYRSK